jgi:type II secretory ATPase GspE/PulE/Tfp pilus assembly ATPase PilB-like protein
MEQLRQIVLGAASGLVFCLVIVLLFIWKYRISRNQLANWLYELGLLLKHRVPVITALEASAERRGAKIILLSQRLQAAVRDGSTLSRALRHELALPLAANAVITSAEANGTLPDALVDAAQLLRYHARPWISFQSQAVRVEIDQNQVQIHELAANYAKESELLTTDEDKRSPLVRIANNIIAQAIQSGADSIDLEPVRTQKPPKGDEYQDEEEWRLLDMEIGPQLLVSFSRDNDRWEVMRVPKSVIGPLYRRLKLMAEVPYWQKPPASGHVVVRLGHRDYDLYLDSEWHPLGERINIQIKRVD